MSEHKSVVMYHLIVLLEKLSEVEHLLLLPDLVDDPRFDQLRLYQEAMVYEAHALEKML